MLAECSPIGFVHTSDIARARDFYVGRLGLEFVEESPFALVVRSGPTMIRITPVDDHRPSPHTVLGWSVTDLSAVLTQLSAAGVEPMRYPGLTQDDHGVWQAPGGDRVAWFSDPDDNTLSLTQFG